mmetsp:Transcript_32068/g.83999  ORF Transcript_32068/g.83999 Transcript_32068/m.83999 type:complete len:120 (+) Transcript_32068:212-571(+)
MRRVARGFFGGVNAVSDSFCIDFIIYNHNNYAPHYQQPEVYRVCSPLQYRYLCVQSKATPARQTHPQQYFEPRTERDRQAQDWTRLAAHGCLSRMIKSRQIQPAAWSQSLGPMLLYRWF